MQISNRSLAFARAALVGTILIGGSAQAGDWPQWRGAKGDGRATEFAAPKAWPKQLPQKWKVAVGDGVATPALVGDKLFVCSRQNENEITRCLNAATGEQIWEDKYPSQSISGPAQSFQGPRSSPAVADGKVITLGTRGTLSCLDAASGKVIWRKEDYKGSAPRFYVSASPIIADGICVAMLGSERDGAIVAYDLKSGEQKWKWTGDGPAYASPAVMTVDGTKLIVAETASKIVALSAADGKLVWDVPFATTGMGYNSACTVVDGQTIIYSGSSRGTRAVKLEKQGDKFVAKERWKNDEKSVQFNTPVVKDGKVYGITQQNELYCLNAEDGKLLWGTQVGPAGGGGGGGRGGDRRGGDGGNAPRQGENARGPGEQGQPGGQGQPGQGQGRGRGGRGGGGGGRGGYGSIVDAGDVLLALTPASELIVFQPGDKAYTEVAKIKVASSPTYAYPVVTDNRIYIKDKDSLIAYAVE